MTPAVLLFDVFGTLVDWRSGVIAALRAFGEAHDVRADWAAFADDWRAAYAPSMDRVRRGDIPWMNLDALHRASLAVLLERYAVGPLDDAQCTALSHAWHTLPAWPEVAGGLGRLRERFIVASLSNGNIALQVDLCRAADLRFDMLFSAESFGHYKPDPQTYLGACALLAVPAARTMLVAAHRDDLAAAKALGLQTAFIARPLEYGRPAAFDAALAEGFDYFADGLESLARQLGA